MHLNRKVLVLVGVLLALPQAVRANPGPDLFMQNTTTALLCTKSVTQRYPERCPAYSPGARETRLEYLRASLPDPLPQLAVEEIEIPDNAISPYTFAYIHTFPTPIYHHPEEAAAGLPPKRSFLAGSNWVSVIGSVEYNGQKWYKINANEYIPAANAVIVPPSRFHGVTLSEQPQYPFGWILRRIHPSTVPGGPVRDDITFNRYDRITLFAQEWIDGQLWYMLGPDEWVNQKYLARVDVDPRPEGVAPGEKWIEVDTFEQTLAAYEGDRMVFATLVASGLPRTWTPNGLTRIWGKWKSYPLMADPDDPPSSSAWYYLEDVEWTQYFRGAYALHAAYWHDGYGYPHSHGCINLSVSDSHWLFNWTTPVLPPGADHVTSGESSPGTWVWVHMSQSRPGINPNG